MNSNTYKLVWLGAAMLYMTLIAHPAAAAGDAEEGKRLGFTCMGCHGIEGYRNAYPSFRVPKLGGQGTSYLETALLAYREGSRPHPTMQAQASSLTDQDIENLLAWISSEERVMDEANSESAAVLESAVACVACHGEDGEGVIPQPPTLAGQHPDYLEYALNQYKQGERSGTVMSAFAMSLSDSDIAALAKFYGRQDGLSTLQQ